MIKKTLLFYLLLLTCSCKEVKVTQGGSGIDSEELKFMSNRINILENRVSVLESKLKINEMPNPIVDEKKVEEVESVK